MRIAVALALLCAASPSRAEDGPCSKEVLDLKVRGISMGAKSPSLIREEYESSVSYACLRDPRCPKNIKVHLPVFVPVPGLAGNVREGRTTYPATERFAVRTVDSEVYWLKLEAPLDSTCDLACMAKRRRLEAGKREGSDRLTLACKQRRVTLRVDPKKRRYTLEVYDRVRGARLKPLRRPLPPGRELPTLPSRSSR